jgi:hypothetical protein
MDSTVVRGFLVAVALRGIQTVLSDPLAILEMECHRSRPGVLTRFHRPRVVGLKVVLLRPPLLGGPTAYPSALVVNDFLSSKDSTDISSSRSFALAGLLLLGGPIAFAHHPLKHGGDA